MLLSDNEDEIVGSEGDVTWYDSRENQPHRSAEYRLYIETGAEAYELASEGDLLLIALKEDGDLLIAMCPSRSTIAQQLLWLFGLSAPSLTDFSVKRIEDTGDVPITLAQSSVLQYLGLEIEGTAENYLETMLERFGDPFRALSSFRVMPANRWGYRLMILTALLSIVWSAKSCFSEL